MRVRAFYIDDHLLLKHYLSNTVNANEYRYVASIEAKDIEDAYAQLNRGSGRESSVLDEDQLRSCSVGDILYWGDLFYLCRPVGWDVVMPSAETTKLYLKAIAAEQRQRA